MDLLSNAFFYWRSSGPNPWVGVIVILALFGLGYLSCRSPKGRLIGMVLFGACASYVAFVFVAFKIWPDEVAISTEEIHGRNDLSPFSLKTSDIRSIRGSRNPKGGYSLHVFLQNKNKAVEIPVIWDHNKEPYKNALHKLRPDAKLDW